MPGAAPPEETCRSKGMEETKKDTLDSTSSAMDMLRGAAPQVQNILNQAKPLLEKLEPAIRAAYPHIVVIKDLVIKGYCIVHPYWDKEVSNIAFALVLLFFGGNFALSIACWQVFQVSGQRLVAKSWDELRTSFQEALTTLKKDSEALAVFGTDNEGNIKVSQIWLALKDVAVAVTDEEKKVARQKVALLLKCIDPSKLWDASIGLWTGVVAVLAILRSRFVQSITIGASVGKKAVDMVAPMVQPKLYEAFPQHQKWVDFVLRAGGGMIGAFAALILIRVISAFNLALEGSTKLVKYLELLNDRKGFMPGWKPREEHKQYMVWAVASVGFLFQLRLGFGLPFLLKIPLTPLLFVEWILTLLAARPF